MPIKVEYKFKYTIKRMGVKLWGAFWDMQCSDEITCSSVKEAKKHVLDLCDIRLRRERWTNVYNKRWIIKNGWNEVILDLVE